MRRSQLMESARLKADIVDGLGADDDDYGAKKKGDEEATRKYAMMKTNPVKERQSTEQFEFDKSEINTNEKYQK